MKSHLALSFAFLAASLATADARHTLAIVDISPDKDATITHIIEPSEKALDEALPSNAEIEAIRLRMQEIVTEMPDLRHHYHAILELYASHEISMAEFLALTQTAIDVSRSDSTGFDDLAALIAQTRNQNP